MKIPRYQLRSARFAPWVTDTGSRVTIRQPRTRRCRGGIVNVASLAASCDVSVAMSRNLLALMGSQSWGYDARGCNCGAKNRLLDICHVLLRGWVNKTMPCYRRAEDGVTLPKFHHAFLRV